MNEDFNIEYSKELLEWRRDFGNTPFVESIRPAEVKQNETTVGFIKNL